MRSTARRGVELACHRAIPQLAHLVNPWVGAIVVKNRRNHRRGFSSSTTNSTTPEIVALKQARKKRAAQSLYVTLEPCLHQLVRTGPCTKAIIAAGVKRVVAAMQDPNPKVAGYRGFAELKRRRYGS